MEPVKERVMGHLRYLAEEIGCRPIGTDANDAAAEYIEKVWKNAGLIVEKQEFEVPNWECEKACLILKGEQLDARANSFSAACDITGEIMPICTLEELEATPHLAGKIVLLYGELSKENFIPKGFTIYNPESHKRVIQLLEEKNPSAIITVRMEKMNDEPIFNDWDLDIPSVTISAETGLMINNCSNAAQIRLIVDSKRSPGKTRNIIGRLNGNAKEKIILTAHYDSVFKTYGAFDNASGVSIILALAEEISTRDDLHMGFEFIAFSSEEYLGLGDQIYLSNFDRTLQDGIAAINFDGIGQSLGTNNMTLMAGSLGLENLLKTIKKGFPAVQWVNPWYESNHYTFFSNGVPSIPFSCTGVSDLLHTPDDRLKWISPEKMNEVFSIALHVIENLQDKTSEWTRSADHKVVGT
ncbi:M28 family metallopeptidase [Falsibacillus albus]|nr:M28 family metallopeptidase [Falsibacillus albus]